MSEIKICSYCKSKYSLNTYCEGEGYCKDHGFYSLNNSRLKITCNECAKEQNRCQLCGKKLDTRDDYEKNKAIKIAIDITKEDLICIKNITEFIKSDHNIFDRFLCELSSLNTIVKRIESEVEQL